MIWKNDTSATRKKTIPGTVLSRMFAIRTLLNSIVISLRWTTSASYSKISWRIFSLRNQDNLEFWLLRSLNCKSTKRSRRSWTHRGVRRMCFSRRRWSNTRKLSGSSDRQKTCSKRTCLSNPSSRRRKASSKSLLQHLCRSRNISATTLATYSEHTSTKKHTEASWRSWWQSAASWRQLPIRELWRELSTYALGCWTRSRQVLILNGTRRTGGSWRTRCTEAWSRGTLMPWTLISLMLKPHCNLSTMRSST